MLSNSNNIECITSQTYAKVLLPAGLPIGFSKSGVNGDFRAGTNFPFRDRWNSGTMLIVDGEWLSAPIAVSVGNSGQAVLLVDAWFKGTIYLSSRTSESARSVRQAVSDLALNIEIYDASPASTSFRELVKLIDAKGYSAFGTLRHYSQPCPGSSANFADSYGSFTTDDFCRE